MAKKKKTSKKNRKQKVVDLASLPVKSLISEAKQQHNAGNFSRAIEMYRHVIKKQPQEKQWVEELGKVYLARIRELAAKVMHKEALAIFRNMVNFCGPPDDPAREIILLLNAESYVKAAEKYAPVAESLERKQRARLDSFFAALFLAGHRECLQYFAKDSQLITHYHIVHNALKAFERDNDEQLEKQLRRIPFSSPFKDFRLIFKGMMSQVAGNTDQALATYAKVPTDSTFYAMAQSCATIIEHDEMGDIFKKAKGAEAEFRAELLGIDPQKTTHAANLDKVYQSNEQLFQFIVSRREMIGEDTARRVCFNILPRIPSKLKTYEKNFGKLNSFDKQRISAFASELEHDAEEAIYYWKLAANNLDRRRKDFSLTIAMICRHVVKLMARLPDYYYEDDIFEELEHSLEFDPVDKDTHLHMLSLVMDSPQERFRVVERAIKALPNDPDIQLAAIANSISRKAFKKASRLAIKLLKTDPINSKARSLLISAHLNHGRKLTKSKKYALAHQEFDMAAAADRSNQAAGAPHICRALLHLVEKNEQEAEKLLRQGCSLAGSEVAGRFRAAVEARLMATSTVLRGKLDKQLKAMNKTAARKDDLFFIIKHMHSLVDEADRANGAQVLSFLFTFINKALKLDYSKEESLAACKFFHDIKDFKHLKTLALKAEKAWPNMQRFIYYRIFSQWRDGRGRIGFREIEELRAIITMGIESNEDPELLTLAEKLIHDYMPPGLPSMPSRLMDMLSEAFLDDLFEDEDYDDFDDDDVDCPF